MPVFDSSAQIADISLWMSDLQNSSRTIERPSLTETQDVDIAIIGAGYTGLWTAYYLKQQAPTLNIALVEAKTVGFGASGRNGGWLMGAIEGESALLKPLPTDDKRRAQQLIYGIVDEARQVIEREQIDCDFHRGGWLNIAARYPEQAQRVQAYLREQYAEGHTEEDYCWLEADAMRQRLNAQHTYGGLHFAHTARVQPAKLVLGLAAAIERLGVTIYEHSPVTQLSNKNGAHTLTTPNGQLQADAVLSCVEGFSFHLTQQRRYILPVQSLIVATEPLSDDLWQDIGLRDMETFSDASRLVTYGQRSADNRLIFGSRGAYQFGGKPKSQFDDCRPVFASITKVLGELLPQLATTRISHCWGGTLGIPRRGCPHAVFDSTAGIGTAGGYVGEGVGASNLMGRTLADLVLGNDSELTRMPWSHRSSLETSLRRWEPEPLRWLGYQGVLASLSLEDAVLNNPRSPAWQRRWVSRLASAAKSIL